MPIFAYILLGIALLITLILITRVRVFICYDDAVRVYARLWFLKFNLIPGKVKEEKKRKKKKKKSDTSATQKPAEKKKSLAAKLWELRKVLTDVLAYFLGKLHFRFIKLHVIVACDNAAKTALLYAGANQGVTYIIEILRNISNVDVAKHSDVYVGSDFISLESSLEGKIELYIRVAPLILVGVHALKEYTKHMSAKED